MFHHIFKVSLDDLSGLCYIIMIIQSVYINVSKLLSILDISEIAISAAFKILNSCNGSINVNLNVTRTGVPELRVKPDGGKRLKGGGGGISHILVSVPNASPNKNCSMASKSVLWGASVTER